MTDDTHYSTQWGIEEYEPPPMLYVVELERNHISALMNAARMAAVVPGVTRVEADLLNAAADSLIMQTVNR